MSVLLDGGCGGVKWERGKEVRRVPILRGCLPSTRRIDVLVANEVGASLWKFSLRRQEVKEMGRWGRRTEGKKVPGVMKQENGCLGFHC